MIEILQSGVTVVLFFLILGTLVLIHELGHFVTARLANVRVLEFGIGFPPRAKVLRASGETLYTLNWLPIGGFVKLEGEDGDDEDDDLAAADGLRPPRSHAVADPRSFARAPLAIRLLILLSGVLMNLAGAFVIFLLIAWLATPLVGITIPAVEPGSPADRAGLESGDAIISIDGIRYDYFDQDRLLGDLRDRAGQTIVLGIDRADGPIEEVTVTLRRPQDVPAGQGVLGIRSTQTQPFLTHFYGQHTGRDLPSAVGIAGSETVHWFRLILDGLGQLASTFVNNPAAPPPVQGPVGIATQIGQVFWGVGPVMTLFVAGILSANLALVNVLPFPPLDGGRMLVIVLKAIFGKRISLRAERLTYFVGFAFLMAFLVWVTYFDVFGGGPP